MYIKEIKIQNIRSIENFEMKFADGEEAGWHVLLGDNGTGKTTILQSIGIGFVEQSYLIHTYFQFKSSNDGSSHEGAVTLKIFDCTEHISHNINISFKTINNGLFTSFDYKGGRGEQREFIKLEERFIAGYGARRSFDGSSRGQRKFGLGKFGMLQNLYDSSVLLMDGLDWISRLDYSIKDGKIPEKYLIHLKNFINKTQLLHSIVLDRIDSAGIYFIDESGYQMEAQYLSSGNQSILSLLLDILRELVEIYGLERVFEDIGKEIPSINLPGVVLIDEVDAHLHPTWQTRIGDWFTKYFPNMQFIVTTHSPLICRGAEKGTIWKLPNPGEMQGVQKITGLEKDKLVYGDILDAYSTEAFGKDIERSESGKEKLRQFSLLSKKKAYGGNLNTEEQADYDKLKGVFSNDAIY